MTRRLIGTGTTDSNGKVAIQYTGIGAGQLQIVAESGDLTSDPYTLYDYIFYDLGTSNNHRTDWTANNVQAAYSDTGTTLTVEGTSSSNYVSGSALTLTDNMTVEVDVTRYSSTNPRFTVKGRQFYLTTARCPIGTEVHLKVVLGEGDATLYVDEVFQETNTTTSSNTTLYFLIYNDGLKFRNLRVY